MLALTLAALGPARAQTPGAEQKRCSQPGDSSKALSDKLDQGGGIICPAQCGSRHESAGAGDR